MLSWLPVLLFAFTNPAFSVSNNATSLTLLYQNNLNATDDVNHVGAILLDSMKQADAASACANLGESLLLQDTVRAHYDDFQRALSYNAYAARAEEVQSYYVADGVLTVVAGAGNLSLNSTSSSSVSLPVLCTQSDTKSRPDTAAATSQNQVSVVTNSSNTYIGYRNKKSFRFSGIPFADAPGRFEYSSAYSKTGQTIQATQYGANCVQFYGGGSEDCLFINIQTPYLPKAGSNDDLRPVLVYIYGGGLTTGSGADGTWDGGNLVSREDIVFTEINYRLGTFGFFAVPGTDVKGNFGLGDIVTALEWLGDNIAAFGGDPGRMTIIGESSGAGLIRNLLGSPQAIGKFSGAISMSGLGGGVDFGATGDYATPYSSYYTIEQSYALAGQNVFQAVGCNQASVADQITCLKSVPAQNIVGGGNVAHFVVQDGTYVNTEELIVTTRNGSAAYVPVIFGIAANDGASFNAYPSGNPPVTSERIGIQESLYIGPDYAQGIIDSGLFPFPNTGNLTLDSFNVSQRVATDNQFRCAAQATVYAGAKTGVFPAAYYYQVDRTFTGYDPNQLGGPPASPGYPNGNPNLPYFRVHSGGLPFLIGNFYGTLRDANDLYAAHIGTAYFGSFIRTGDPNPPPEYLSARGYDTVIKSIQASGTWDKVGDMAATGNVRFIDSPSSKGAFVDMDQCKYLNYSISYYLDGGR